MGRPGRKIKDLTQYPPGSFGRLTPIRVIGRYRGGALWECECSCGNLASVPSTNLINGQQSCGCSKGKTRFTLAKLESANQRAMEVEKLLLQGLSLRKVGEKLGISHQRVAQILYRVGKKVKDVRPTIYRRLWTEEEIALLGTAPDGEIARRLGLCQSTIWNKRTTLNIPPYIKPPPITKGFKSFRLTAQKRVMKRMNDGFRRAHWWCSCSCGNRCLVSETSLAKRLQKSCGCLQKEWAKKLGSSRRKEKA